MHGTITSKQRSTQVQRWKWRRVAQRSKNREVGYICAPSRNDRTAQKEKGWVRRTGPWLNTHRLPSLISNQSADRLKDTQIRWSSHTAKWQIGQIKRLNTDINNHHNRGGRVRPPSWEWKSCVKKIKHRYPSLSGPKGAFKQMNVTRSQWQQCGALCDTHTRR